MTSRSPYFTHTVRRIGVITALATTICLVVYVIALTIGLLTLPSPQTPIGDPIFSLLELLIIITAPFMVVAMVVVHAYASAEQRAYSLAALAFMILLAGITCCVHFAILTVSHHPTAAGLPPVFFSFTWPSIAYALDILAWDLFFGLSMLFAVPVFTGDKSTTWLRITMLASGVLSLAGMIAVPLGDMQLRLIGVLGYAGITPVVFLLLANVFRRAPVQHV